MTGPVGGAPDAPKPKSNVDLPNQIQAGRMQYGGAKGQAGFKMWFKRHFPNLTDKQVDTATAQFTQTMMKLVQQTIQKDLAKQRKAARQMKKSIEGDD